jgi:hypothetical protein
MPDGGLPGSGRLWDLDWTRVVEACQFIKEMPGLFVDSHSVSHARALSFRPIQSLHFLLRGVPV